MTEDPRPRPAEPAADPRSAAAAAPRQEVKPGRVTPRRVKHPTTRRQRGINRGLIAGGVLLLAGSLVPVPFVIMSPGPTFNTIGEYQDQPVIEISGTKTYPTRGNLDMTTVSERGGSSGGVNTVEVVAALVRRGQVVVPRDALYPDDRSGEDIRQANAESFETSQSDAVAAALSELGIPAVESVVVNSVAGDSPASGIVRAGDIVLAVDGQPVSSPEDVVRLVRERDVGDAIALKVRRAGDDDKPTEVGLSVVAAANPDPESAGAPYLGIAVAPFYEAPFDIDFTLDTVGGPSAGLMFSLAIVDKLTQGPLTGGGHVAGTGTITPDGTVGTIGGIRHKMAGAARTGAKLFLAPRGNCDEVVGHIPEGLTVVPVETLSQARETVARWAEDPTAEFPSCTDAG